MLPRILVKSTFSYGKGGGCGVGGASESLVESEIASISVSNPTAYRSSLILGGISASSKSSLHSESMTFPNRLHPVIIAHQITFSSILVTLAIYML
jgi:hypothetical protein